MNPTLMPVYANLSRSITLLYADVDLASYLLDCNPSCDILLASANGSLVKEALSVNKSNSNKPLNLIETNFTQANRYIGTEYQKVIYDARKAFDVNAYTAVCGTLVGGGELVLLLSREQTLFYQNNASHHADLAPRGTLARLLTSLIMSSTCRAIPSKFGVTFTNSDVTQPNQDDENQSFEKAQAQLIGKIQRCALGHAKRPLVITANRGRGKSAALGIAIAELIQQSEIAVFVTAPNKSQLKVFYKHLFARLLESHNETELDLIVENRVKFIATDKVHLLAKNPGLLIVEEAGAIPIQVLESFLEQVNRLIFSTTVDGYEGNGQGFAIRFNRQLKQTFPQYQSYQLHVPARWSSNDLLEEVNNQAFLLNYSKNLTQLDKTSLSNTASIQYTRINKQQLASDEAVLKQLYGLLVTAHYQTRPSDLERILNDDSIKVFVGKLDNQVVAAALVAHEGKLTTQEFNRLENNDKRLSGQLTPQSLIVHRGLIQAGLLSYCRIMRVAVRHEFRRQQIATQLITHIEAYASNNQIDMLSSSFAQFTDVIRFWFSNGFNISRLGLRKDSSSGAHSGEYLKQINTKNPIVSEVFQRATEGFNRSFFYNISSSLSCVRTEVLLELFCQTESLHTSQLTANETNRAYKEVAQYIKRHRSLEMLEWSLYELAKTELAPALSNLSVSHFQASIIFSKLLQRKNWSDISLQFGFSGIKESREKTRLAVASMLQTNL